MKLQVLNPYNQEVCHEVSYDEGVILEDDNPNVRLMVAQVIEHQGKSAVVALPALMAACREEGEQVHVLRNLVMAIGTIGPEAARALPILQKLQAHPRIRWAANASIGNITGKPRGTEGNPGVH